MYTITSDGSLWELLQRNVDVKHQIHLIVDIEEVITTSTSPIKAKPRVQLEEIVDNSVAIVPLCGVGTSKIGIHEVTTSTNEIDEGPNRI